MYYCIFLQLMNKIHTNKIVKSIFLLGTLSYLITMLVYDTRFYSIIIPLDISYTYYNYHINNKLDTSTIDNNIKDNIKIDNSNKILDDKSKLHLDKSYPSNEVNENIHFIRLEHEIKDSVKYTLNNLSM